MEGQVQVAGKGQDDALVQALCGLDHLPFHGRRRGIDAAKQERRGQANLQQPMADHVAAQRVDVDLHVRQLGHARIIGRG